MSDSTLTRLFETPESRFGAIVAAYLLYVLIYLALGDDALQSWPEIITIALALWVSVFLIKCNQGSIRVFFVILSIAIAFDLINVLFLQIPDPALVTRLLIPLNTASTGDDTVGLSYFLFALHLFVWNCAWALLAYRMARQIRHGRTFLAVGALLTVGLVLLISYELDTFDFNFNIPAERFHFLYLVMELLGILLGLMCVLMGLNRALLLAIVGFTIGAANNILSVFNELYEQSPVPTDTLLGLIGGYIDPGSLAPLWTLGHIFLLIGLALVQVMMRSDAAGSRMNTRFYDASKHDQSGLSVYILMFWLISVAVAMIAVHNLNETPHLLTMFLILFSATCVIVIAGLTSRFDQMVDFVTDWMRRLFQSRLNTDISGAALDKNRHWLSVTAMDDIINVTKKEVDALRNDIIFLGPERLNRPAARVTREGDVSCFMIMPFNQDWSTDIAQAMRLVCAQADVRGFRGDDMFRPTDILDDIWTGIMESDFIIADVTGNNANVFYELGMAHALGKPVIILAQDPDEVPFDLKSRRILIYDLSDLKSLQNQLQEYVEQVLKTYELRG